MVTRNFYPTLPTQATFQAINKGVCKEGTKGAGHCIVTSCPLPRLIIAGKTSKQQYSWKQQTIINAQNNTWMSKGVLHVPFSYIPKIL